MNGFFNIKLLDSGGFKDEDFLQAKKEGKLKELISSLGTDDVFYIQNRIFDTIGDYLLFLLFSVPRSSRQPFTGYFTTDPDTTRAQNPAFLAFICLLSTDSDTDTYIQEWNGAYDGQSVTYDDVYESVQTERWIGASRVFIEEEMFPYSISMSNNRDEISFTNAFMYLPSHCVASDIRSIGIFTLTDKAYETSSTGNPLWYKGIARCGRVRIKDSDGNPITIIKTENQVLFIEYEFRLVSV